MQLFRLSGSQVVLSVVVSVSLLTGCLSSSGSSSNEDEGVPPLPDAAGAVINDRYQPLGEEAAIVLDTKTNLAWKRCYHGQTWSVELATCEGTAAPLTWNVARSFIDGDGFRLPSLEEATSLVYCNNLHASAEQIGDLDIFEGCGSPTLSPTIEPTVFPDMRQLTVWVSDEEPDSITKLGVNFSSGVVSEFNSPGVDYRVILVRDPEDGDNPLAADGSRPRQSAQ